MSNTTRTASDAPPDESTVKDGAPDCTVPSSIPAVGGTEGGSAVGTGKSVLLLEDDIFFRAVIEDFLIENGFSVTTGQSGVDGILAVLANDFAVILCDMNMPGLAGDLFFHAVERARPDFCERFIFMTGYRGDERANAFIKSVDCVTLMKPFWLDDLLAAVKSLDGRKRSPRPRPSLPPLVHSVASRRTGLPDRESPGSQELSASVPSVASSQLGGASGAGLAGRRRIVTPFLGLVLFGSVAAIAGAWYSGLRQSESVAAAEVAALEARWAGTSKLVQNAEKARPRLEASIALAKRIVEERNSPRWTRMLRSVSGAPGLGVEWTDLQMGETQSGSGAGELRVSGIARGANPRMAADRFRQALEKDLRHLFNQSIVRAHFDRLDDASPDAVSGERGAVFTIIATANARVQEPGKE